MKLYQVNYTVTANEYDAVAVLHHAFASSESGAAKIRATLRQAKKDLTNSKLEIVDTEVIDVQPTRSGLIAFLNGLTPHDHGLFASPGDAD